MLTPHFHSPPTFTAALGALLVTTLLAPPSLAQLSTTFYSTTCPTLTAIVRQTLQTALASDPRITASLIRAHFHDCFVQGCDGSLLLNSTADGTIVSEQFAGPNNSSIRGLDVVDTIKSAVEAACPQTVSCADILAVAAQVGVTLAGGPNYTVPVGRRDGRTANQNQANTAIPAPTDTLTAIIGKFTAVGLTTDDVTVLSGAHTMGRAQCRTFSSRLYNFNGTNGPDGTLNATYRTALQGQCPQNGGGATPVNLDVTTPNNFDNAYYQNLLVGQGLLQSDQELSAANASTAANVSDLASNQAEFFTRFSAAMIRMGSIGVLTGTQGEIRQSCNRTN